MKRIWKLGIWTLVGLAPCTGITAEMTFSTVEFPGADETIVRGINNLGVVVGEYGDIEFSSPLNIGNRGFIFDGENYESLYVPGSASTGAYGINDSGHVVGEYIAPDGNLVGFLYDGSTYHDIVTPFASGASAADINNLGQIVGSYSDDDFVVDVHGFYFDGEVFAARNYPRSDMTFLTGINDVGQQIGTFSNTDTAVEGFLLPGFTSIVHPDGLATNVKGINDQGQIIGTYTVVSGALEASFNGFVYSVSDDAFSSLEFPGPECKFNYLENFPKPPSTCLPSMEDINSRGQIVGYHDNNDGVYRGFIGTPELLLQAGDADMDLDFDQLDLVQVQIAAKYLTGEPANWGEGDWDGAPGGTAGSPPTGDGLFNQFDIIAAQQAGLYLAGPYGARQPESVAVPEPATCSLLLLGMVVVGWCSQRRLTLRWRLDMRAS